MRSLSATFLCLVLTACANAPAPDPVDHSANLLNDSLFSPASERISPDDVFALSDDMQRYLDNEMARQIAADGKIAALVNALYHKGRQKFAFDAAATGNAADTFKNRSGNCLSFTIMTGAFAKRLGIPVQFHSVSFGEVWDRKDNVDFLIGHVNLSLGEPTISGRETGQLVDFGAFEDARGELMEDIGEDVIVAMYMNNRAAEALSKDNLNDAYWWARAAIRHTPAFLPAYNTLGVVYTVHHNLPEAEQVLRHVLEREPDNMLAMSNQIRVLNALGRAGEASVLATRLAKIQPYPPYFFFNRGLAAMRAGDYRTARSEFTKEVNRASYSHQFHFWLALANYYLGNIGETRKQLNIAMENSPNAKQHDLYAAKLARLGTGSQH